MKKLKEVMPIDSPGIFTMLASAVQGFDLWDVEAGEFIDLNYIGNHSGEKMVSPLVTSLMGENELISDDDVLERLANLIYAKFGANWTKQFKYLKTDYDPIDNYNLEEVITPDLTTTIDAKQNAKVDTTLDDNTTNRQVYGFNSTDPVNATKDSNTQHSTMEGSWDDNKQNTIQKQQGTSTTKRHGNIGVTMTSELLTKDAQFWSNWNIWNTIMNDVDSILTLGIY